MPRCVDVLLAADVRGQRTHGVTHLRDYCDRMIQGTSRPGDDAEFTLTSPTSYVVDTKYGGGRHDCVSFANAPALVAPRAWAPTLFR